MLKKIDWYFVFPIIILILLGVSICLIGSYHISIKYYNDGYAFYLSHIFSISIGLIVFAIGLSINIDKVFFRYHLFWGILCLILLFIVLVPGIGKETLGARRWVKLGPISFQASEISKILLLFFLSFVLQQKREYNHSFLTATLPPMVFLFINIFLIILEPDLSTALIFLGIGCCLFFIYRMPIPHLLLMIVSIFPILIAFLQIKSYAFKRLIFFDPLIDPYDKGYHLFQSFLSFKRGGIFGNDTSEVLSQMKFFPDAYTDFSFALIGQQFGLFGCLVTLLLYLFIFYRGIKIIFNVKDHRFFFLGFGIVATLIIETTFHLLVNVGLVPTTGIAFTFRQLWQNGIGQ